MNLHFWADLDWSNHLDFLGARVVSLKVVCRLFDMDDIAQLLLLVRYCDTPWTEKPIGANPPRLGFWQFRPEWRYSSYDFSAEGVRRSKPSSQGMLLDPNPIHFDRGSIFSNPQIEFSTAKPGEKIAPP